MRPDLYLLDTSILLALIRGKSLGEYIDRTYNLRVARFKPLISIVTHGEIKVLDKYYKWGKEKSEKLQLMLNNVNTIDIDFSIVSDYVELDYYSRKCKPAVTMGKNDLWIAATAKATEAILLTTDKDFNHLPLDVLKYSFIDPTPYLSTK
jgi:predicted nucleic acid-binding protein